MSGKDDTVVKESTGTIYCRVDLFAYAHSDTDPVGNRVAERGSRPASLLLLSISNNRAAMIDEICDANDYGNLQYIFTST